MFTKRLSNRLAGLAGSALLAPLALAAVAPAAALASPLIGFSASAYGTSATLG